MVDFIRIKGSPIERAFQQGEQLREKIHTTFDVIFHSKMFSEVTSKILPLGIIKIALSIIGRRSIKKSLQELLPKQYEKIKALSEGAVIKESLIYGGHFVEVMSGNPKSLYKTPPVQSCSMLFAHPEATSDNSLIFLGEITIFQMSSNLFK